MVILKLMFKPIISGPLAPGMHWLALSLCVLCAPVHAHWENVGLYSAGIYYVDTASVVREGDTRRLTSLLDYRSTQSSSEGQKIPLDPHAIAHRLPDRNSAHLASGAFCGAHGQRYAGGKRRHAA